MNLKLLKLQDFVPNQSAVTNLPESPHINEEIRVGDKALATIDSGQDKSPTDLILESVSNWYKLKFRVFLYCHV